MRFKLFKQTESMDCGAFCLKMVLYYYGLDIDINWLRAYTNTNREGVSLFGMRYALEELGFKGAAYKLSINDLQHINLPCILHWDNRHFVVLYKIQKKREKYVYHIADPGGSKLQIRANDLEKSWISSSDSLGYALQIIPTDISAKRELPQATPNVKLLFSKIKPYKSHWAGIFCSVLTLLLLQILIPFMTQSIIDRGIGGTNFDYIKLIITIQLVFFIMKILIEFIRNIVLLKISILVSLDTISNYIHKVINLPIAFFNTKVIGDFVQRISDGQTVEEFLTYKLLDTIYAILTVVIFLPILCYYSFTIFGIFLIGSILYLSWSYLFWEKRRKINHLQFLANSTSQTSTIEIFQGIEDIKLNTCGNKKLANWIKDKKKVFNIKIKGLFLEQLQEAGGQIISQSKNILILLLSSYLVINGNISLGALLAITYVTAQTDYPLTLFLSILRSFQDAKLSLTRLDEVSKIMNEDSNIPHTSYRHINLDGDIQLNEVSFKYDITSDAFILKSLNETIKKGEITAVVGSSGSGKTTLFRLLLGLYDPDKGEILINGIDLKKIPKDQWRSLCATVTQDGFCFSDTIANNITLSSENPDEQRILQALQIASIYDFVMELPLGINTRIGEDGIKMSKGQLQRILLARAIYKNAPFLFLDEPTNSLDAVSENAIIHALKTIYTGKTVFIIAHRFSTIKNADKILVLHAGQIVEAGNHEQLFKQKGYYYNLFINQRLF